MWEVAAAHLDKLGEVVEDLVDGPHVGVLTHLLELRIGQRRLTTHTQRTVKADTSLMLRG